MDRRFISERTSGESKIKADAGNAYGKERLEFLKGWMERNKQKEERKE